MLNMDLLCFLSVCLQGCHSAKACRKSANARYNTAEDSDVWYGIMPSSKQLSMSHKNMSRELVPHGHV